MSRVKYAFLLAALVICIGPPTTAAASGSSQQCEAAGGTYTKDGPNSICVFPEEGVANENANPNNNSATTQTTTTGQGNVNNKPEDSCTGVPGKCK